MGAGVEATIDLRAIAHNVGVVRERSDEPGRPGNDEQAFRHPRLCIRTVGMSCSGRRSGRGYRSD